MAMATEQRFLTNYANGTLCVSGARCANSQTRQTGIGYARQHGQHSRVTSETPKNADYASLTARITSFCGWDIHTISSNELAEAGFYYTGIKDYVRCFFCGCGVKDWDRGDKPWIEHARWSPNCAFLNQQKSEEFVRLCQSSNINDREKAERLLLNQGPQHQGHDEDQQTSFTHQSSAESPTSVEWQSSFISETSSETSEPSLDEEQLKILKENRELKQQRLCKICLNEEACIVFLPCGHLVSCVPCSHALNRCAVCRAAIQGKIRAYPAYHMSGLIRENDSCECCDR